MDEKYKEYERSLFKRIDEYQFEFQPFDALDAEYWLWNYNDWLNSAEIYLSVGYKKMKDPWFHTLKGRYIYIMDVLEEVKKALWKLNAIYKWYNKENLIPPDPELLFPFDPEYEAMDEGYHIRVENWYNAKLEKIKNKFSQIDDVHQEKHLNDANLKLPTNRWEKEVIRILNKTDKPVKTREILRQLDDLEIPTSYNSIKKIFNTRIGKRYFNEQIVNEGSYYSLKNPELIPKDF